MLSLSEAKRRRNRYYLAAASLLVFSHVELVIGLFASADQWPWSSFRFYYLEDSSVLAWTA
jgi:hypothetical protein